VVVIDEVAPLRVLLVVLHDFDITYVTCCGCAMLLAGGYYR
jgi:hypothetical protein